MIKEIAKGLAAAANQNITMDTYMIADERAGMSVAGQASFFKSVVKVDVGGRVGGTGLGNANGENNKKGEQIDHFISDSLRQGIYACPVRAMLVHKSDQYHAADQSRNRLRTIMVSRVIVGLHDVG